jgi:hypothetical protein
MNTIKSFSEFLNEGKGEDSLLAAAGSMFNTLINGDDNKETGTGPSTTIGTHKPGEATTIDGTNGTSDIKINTVPGNDDFTLYMQHQQGIAGAKGLIQASQGTGKMAPDTIKTKKGTKYANLVMNIPKDRPQIKANLIKALDAGDQKTAALLFLNMWKEKWASKGKEALTNISQAKNAAVKQAIQKYCSKYGVPFEFAATVANIESGFNPKAGNNRYKGLFALSQEEFSKYVPGGNIYNLDNNVNAGIQCLRNNIRDFKKYLGPATLATLNLGAWANSIA